MLETIAALIGAGVMVAIGLFALAKGGRPERIGAGTMLSAWFLSILTQTYLGYAQIQWPMFLIDLGVLGVFIALVWKSPRTWPVWAAAFQLLTVASHVMVMMKLKPEISSFYTVLNMTAYGIMIAIAVGAFFAWQERRAVGIEDPE
ncbi:MAG: hypothetical protein J0I52_00680 [Bordetella sp.]|nr:hypothetical protein [Bordetella sp.]